MKNITDALAQYITVLADSYDRTSRAEDRPLYLHHLAEAAIIFSLIHQGTSQEAIEEKLASERHGFGWNYLSGPEGDAAERAFVQFDTLVIDSGLFRPNNHCT